MDEHSKVRSDLSPVIMNLLKGVVYREADLVWWEALLALQPQVRDYCRVLRLELVLDEAEGYAFLRSKVEDEAEEQTKVPRLIVRRSLSFPVSLLLALLRKKLAESDAGGGETRLIMTRNDIVELIRVFLPSTTNEARVIDQIETHINKVIDLGFLKRIKGAGQQPTFEVQRIIKAFVDAQWLADFDARLAGYKAHLLDGTNAGETGDD